MPRRRRLSEYGSTLLIFLFHTIVMQSFFPSGKNNSLPCEQHKQNYHLSIKLNTVQSTLHQANILKNTAITSQVGFVFEENSGRQITRLSWRHQFRKALFLKCFLSTLKCKAGIFFNSSIWNALFSCWISAENRPSCRNKAGLLNFSSVLWTGPELHILAQLVCIMFHH